VAWITEHEADIESDLSAFHRVDDPMTLDGPRYFRLVMRLTAYAGVLAARAYAESEEARNAANGAHSAAPTTYAPAAKSSHVSDAAMIATLGDDWVEHVVEREGE
jgi:hypothetical protein